MNGWDPCRLKVWKSPKYEAYTKKGKSVNEGSYVCEVLAPLINIVMSDLPKVASETYRFSRLSKLTKGKI